MVPSYWLKSLLLLLDGPQDNSWMRSTEERLANYEQARGRTQWGRYDKELIWLVVWMVDFSENPIKQPLE